MSQSEFKPWVPKNTERATYNKEATTKFLNQFFTTLKNEKNITISEKQENNYIENYHIFCDTLSKLNQKEIQDIFQNLADQLNDDNKQPKNKGGNPGKGGDPGKFIGCSIFMAPFMAIGIDIVTHIALFLSLIFTKPGAAAPSIYAAKSTFASFFFPHIQWFEIGIYGVCFVVAVWLCWKISHNDVEDIQEKIDDIIYRQKIDFKDFFKDTINVQMNGSFLEFPSPTNLKKTSNELSFPPPIESQFIYNNLILKDNKQYICIIRHNERNNSENNKYFITNLKYLEIEYADNLQKSDDDLFFNFKIINNNNNNYTITITNSNITNGLFISEEILLKIMYAIIFKKDLEFSFLSYRNIIENCVKNETTSLIFNDKPELIYPKLNLSLINDDLLEAIYKKYTNFDLRNSTIENIISFNNTIYFGNFYNLCKNNLSLFIIYDREFMKGMRYEHEYIFKRKHWINGSNGYNDSIFQFCPSQYYIKKINYDLMLDECQTNVSRYLLNNLFELNLNSNNYLGILAIAINKSKEEIHEFHHIDDIMSYKDMLQKLLENKDLQLNNLEDLKNILNDKNIYDRVLQQCKMIETYQNIKSTFFFNNELDIFDKTLGFLKTDDIFFSISFVASLIMYDWEFAREEKEKNNDPKNDENYQDYPDHPIVTWNRIILYFYELNIKNEIYEDLFYNIEKIVTNEINMFKPGSGFYKFVKQRLNYDSESNERFNQHTFDLFFKLILFYDKDNGKIFNSTIDKDILHVFTT